MKNRFCLWISTAVLALITCTGGIFAAFQYANGSAESKSANVSSVLAEFSYGGNPPGYNEEHQQVIDIALSEENGINDQNFSSKFGSVVFRWLANRYIYGYVGNMDPLLGGAKYFGTPEEVSFIMTRPEIDPDKQENIYIFLAEITETELNAMSVGDILDNVYRVKLFKNASGKYEQGECKKGYSTICSYENPHPQQYDTKGFAVFEKNIIWQEGSPA